MKKLLLNYKLITALIGVIIYIFGITLFSYYNYSVEKRVIINAIDRDLIKGAMGAVPILGEDFHNTAVKKDAVESSKDFSNTYNLSKYAESQGLKYVYTMVKKDGKIYFTSSSATAEELKSGDYTKYFDEYEEATQKLKDAFDNGKVFYEEAKDRWGDFRSVIIPLKAPNGNIYIVGADITISHIKGIFKDSFTKSLLTALFFIFLAVPFIAIFIMWNKKDLEILEEEVTQRTEEIRDLNETLEERIKVEIEKNREKDMILMKQTGLAAMGEMIGNIAHQWRQPINAVGLIIQDLEEAYEFGELNDEYMKTQKGKAMELINFMSGTINDFRNFFRPDKEKEEFSITESIKKSITIIDSVLKNNNIAVKLELEEGVNAFGYRNEYSQAVLNIIGNAKDILIERKIAEPLISVKVFKENGKSIVLIKDNGGGIPESVVENIFQPYFTTKEPGKGTGLGLYMSKTIIEKNMDGKLSFENTEDGVVFRIEV